MVTVAKEIVMKYKNSYRRKSYKKKKKKEKTYKENR